MTTPFRVRDHGCRHAETYNYYLPSESVDRVWVELAATFGPVRRGRVLPTREIDGKQLRLRATSVGNPTTVIQKRGWRPEALGRLHAILGFERKVSNAG